jgi:hypothetical protein
MVGTPKHGDLPDSTLQLLTWYSFRPAGSTQCWSRLLAKAVAAHLAGCESKFFNLHHCLRLMMVCCTAGYEMLPVL